MGLLRKRVHPPERMIGAVGSCPRCHLVLAAESDALGNAIVETILN